MREIAVDVYPVTPTFSSAEAAIAHAKSYPPLIKAKADEKLVRDAQMVDAFWTDADFVIRFSNGRFLHVFVNPKEARMNVEWRLLDNQPITIDEELGRVGSPAVVLNFPKGDRYVMDRSAIISSRLGKQAMRFFVSELGFRLYAPQLPILCFNCIYRSKNHENLLFVHEDR